MYHHLKASMRQRFSIFNVTANYTYYHGMSDQEDRRGGKYCLPVDSYNLHQEWGNTVDPRHDFNASVNSRLPLDVYLTTVIQRKERRFLHHHDRQGRQQGWRRVNDRPPGVAKNSEVGPHYFDVSFNFSKAFEFKRGRARAVRQPPGLK